MLSKKLAYLFLLIFSRLIKMFRFFHRHAEYTVMQTKKVHIIFQKPGFNAGSRSRTIKVHFLGFWRVADYIKIQNLHEALRGLRFHYSLTL